MTTINDLTPAQKKAVSIQLGYHFGIGLGISGKYKVADHTEDFAECAACIANLATNGLTGDLIREQMKVANS